MSNEPSPDDSTPEMGNGRLTAGGRTHHFVWGLCSDAGRHRDHNEDFADATVAGSPTSPFFAVADGLGGHAAGEVASRVAVEASRSVWLNPGSSDPAKTLRSAARAANRAVFDESLNTGQSGMGTTLTVLTMTSSEVIIAHVGDSRVYRVRSDSCVQLTVDHSRVGEMLRMKLLNAEQAARHPARSQLTRSLGAAPAVQIDLIRDRLDVGDAFVICTDGLWDAVSNLDIGRALAEIEPGDRSAKRVAHGLVQTAIDRDCADNVTAVVVQVTALPPPVASDKRSLFRRHG